MTRLAVFGYASLVSRNSASQTIGREVPEPVPARLSGWRRRWSEKRDNLRCEKTFARREDGTLPPLVLGLNVERGEDPAGPVNGVLIPVTGEEAERLDIREMRYDRVEVTEQIDTDGRPFDRIYTYVVKSENFAPEPPGGAVILGTYAMTVEAAFGELGDGELEAYRATTGPLPVEVIDPVLVRDQIPPGNPRLW